MNGTKLPKLKQVLSNKKFRWVLAGFVLILAGATAGYWYGTKQIIAPTPISQTSQIPETPEPTPITEPESEPEQITPTQVKPPETFGYTNPTDLYGIGVRASFPQGVTISYRDPASSYTATMGEYDTVTLSLEDYSGGGRRDWFLANHGWPDNVFEPFAANNHSGYISYYRDSDGKISGPFFYFTVVGSDKMLLVTSYNNTSSVYFFASDLERFKSFLSTIQITKPDVGSVDPSRKEDTRLRWSDTRQTVWGSSELGLRITVPEWVENKESGTRITQKANVYENIVSISSPLASVYPRLEILDEKYIGQGFERVVSEILPGAGFCKTEWKKSKAECERQLYCYTRDEVVQNFFLKGTTTVGPYQAQLWALRADFSQRNDCRAEDWWLIKAKGGRFVATNINPKGEITRIESL